MRWAVACAAAVPLACAAPAPWRSTIAVPEVASAKIAEMPRATHAAPATAAEITRGAQLLDGDAATGELGDFVLDNGLVVVVVGAIDGSPRGGAIVDLAGARRTDALASMETRVAGEQVRYDDLHAGVEPTSGAAFIEVVGEVAGAAATTRYELYPGLDAVLIHTAFHRPSTIPEEVKFAVADRLVGGADARATCNPDFGPGQCLLSGAGQSYVLDALHAQGANAGRVGDTSAIVGIEPSSCMPGPRLYTRFLAPLARPDSLAHLAALAVAHGEQVGDLDLTILPRPWSPARIVEPGRFWFAPLRGGLPVSLETAAPYHPGDRVTARVPEGDWYIWFTNDAYVSSGGEDVHVHVEGGDHARFTVGATLRTLAP